jgi:hypothetical protein
LGVLEQIKVCADSITFTFKENVPGRMAIRILLILLLAAVVRAQGATEVQRAIIKGTIILNGEGGPGIANVQITDSAHTGGPWASDSDGSFILVYPKRAPGDKVRLGVIKEGYVVVNWVQLDLADQAKAGAEKAAAELARNQPGQGSEMYQEAQRLFLEGKIEAAIALLDDDKLRQAAVQAEKALTDAIQGWRLKANLCIG